MVVVAVQVATSRRSVYARDQSWEFDEKRTPEVVFREFYSEFAANLRRRNNERFRDTDSNEILITEQHERQRIWNILRVRT